MGRGLDTPSKITRATRPASDPQGETMKTVTLKIPSITCSHCIHTITTELMSITGVKKVTGDENTKEVTVEFDSPATIEIIRDVLTEINYEPTNI
jgi:copper chaperone CopZ